MTKTMDEVTFKRIKKILALVWKSKLSDFYREKYKKSGFTNVSREIKTPEDFFRLPVLTRDDLALVSPFDRFYLMGSRMLELSATSGTTLRPPVLSLRPAFRQNSHSAPRRSFFKNATKILFLNQPMRVSSRFLSIKDEEKKLPVVVIAGDPNNFSGTAYIAGAARVDGIVSSVNQVIELARYLAKNYDCRKIRYISLVGEMLTGSRFAVLRQLYPNAIVDSAYALSEARALGRLCGLARGRPVYHINSRVHYEILDNELVVTNLEVGDIGTPLIRYRTGDSIGWIHTKCICGRPEKQFVLLGRVGGDFVKVAGGEIWGDVVEKAAFRFPEIKDFRLHVYEERVGESIKPKIVFEVLTRGKVDKPRLLLEKLSSAIPISPRHTLFDAQSAGLILPLEIRRVEAFPEANKPGRIIFHGA